MNSFRVNSLELDKSKTWMPYSGVLDKAKTIKVELVIRLHYFGPFFLACKLCQVLNWKKKLASSAKFASEMDDL